MNDAPFGSAQVEIFKNSDDIWIAKIDVQSVLVKGEGSLSSVGTGGSTAPLALSPAVTKFNIKRIYVLKTAGSATSWTVKIYRTNISPGDIDLDYNNEGIVASYLDRLTDIPFENEDEESEIYVKVIPNAGNDNNFSIRIAGHKTA